MAFLKFFLRRLLAIPVTLVVITAALYALIMVAPPEERASLYLGPNTRSNLPQAQAEAQMRQILREYGLDDPYPVQYARWLNRLLHGDWGYSPLLNSDVWPALRHRTPVTVELLLYSLLLLFPIGLFGGLVSGWNRNSATDGAFRFAAFMATAIPPFILGLFLLSLFYVGTGWFPPGRTSLFELSFQSSTFRSYTGLLTVDGLLNGRLDVTIDAARHLVLPVFSLSLLHWATLGRITRAGIIEEKGKPYIVSAFARGLRERTVANRHALRNTLVPALTSTALSAAALLTGVYVIEIIFNLKGISELITRSVRTTPDAPLTLGFAVYSVLLVMPLMLLLDLLTGLVDPRIRAGNQPEVRPGDG